MRKIQEPNSTRPAKAGPLRLGAFKSDAGGVPILERVQSWTRDRFELPQDATVLVTEVACLRPGCPPLETVIAFWTDGDRRQHFRVFKSLEEVVPDDLPPRWLRDALCASERDEFECC